MIISKKEAKIRRIKHDVICDFHKNNPDQEGVYNCCICRIIQDPCGCGIDEGCNYCIKQSPNEKKEV